MYIIFKKIVYSKSIINKKRERSESKINNKEKLIFF